jgi:hypothetical protein
MYLRTSFGPGTAEADETKAPPTRPTGEDRETRRNQYVVVSRATFSDLEGTYITLPSADHTIAGIVNDSEDLEYANAGVYSGPSEEYSLAHGACWTSAPPRPIPLEDRLGGAHGLAPTSLVCNSAIMPMNRRNAMIAARRSA